MYFSVVVLLSYFLSWWPIVLRLAIGYYVLGGPALICYVSIVLKSVLSRAARLVRAIARSQTDRRYAFKVTSIRERQKVSIESLVFDRLR